VDAKQIQTDILLALKRHKDCASVKLIYLVVPRKLMISFYSFKLFTYPLIHLYETIINIKKTYSNGLRKKSIGSLLKVDPFPYYFSEAS